MQVTRPHAHEPFQPYRRQRHDKVVQLGLPRGRHHLIHADLPHVVAVLDVLGDAAVEQNRLLGHDADLGAQEGDVDTAGYPAVDQLRTDIDFNF